MFRSILFIALSLMFISCEDKPKDESTFEVKTYTLEDLNGKKYLLDKQGANIKVRGYENQVIILDIFAVWCPSCKVISPYLSHMQEKYKGKLLVLGLSTDTDKEPSYYEKFIRKHNANYAICNTSENNLVSQRVAIDVRHPRSFPIPLVIMYDTDGNYFRHYQGAMPQEILDRDIASALGKK